MNQERLNILPYSNQILLNIVGAGAVGMGMAVACSKRLGSDRIAVFSRKGMIDSGELLLKSVLYDGTFTSETLPAPCVVTTKVYSLPAALKIPSRLGSQEILCLQNGFKIEDQFPKHLHIARGLVSVAASRSRDFHNRAIWDTTMRIILDGRNKHSSLFQSLLSNDAIHVDVVPNFSYFLGQKIIANAALNSVSVASRLNCQELRSNSFRMKQMVAIAIECKRVLAYAGFPPLPDGEEIITKALASCGTSDFKPSTLQDYESGNPTELPWLLNTIRQLAEDSKVEIPVMNGIFKMIFTESAFR